MNQLLLTFYKELGAIFNLKFNGKFSSVPFNNLDCGSDYLVFLAGMKIESLKNNINNKADLFLEIIK
jgi:hypothetical protein